MLIVAQTGFGIGAVDQTRHHQSKSYASSQKMYAAEYVNTFEKAGKMK
jgi:hypothetical protein